MFLIRLFQKRTLSKIVKERDVKFMPIENVKSVSFVFDIGDENVLEAVKSLTSFLNDRRIDYNGLAINFSKNDYPAFVLDYQIKILTKKDVSFIGTPNLKIIDKVISGNTDLYMDFCSSYSYTHEFIATSSEATFKVGRFNYNNSPFDFVVEMSAEENSPMEYLKKVFYYLSTIKSA